MGNGVIPDPFYRMNELDVQWVDKLQWEYRKEFTVTPELLAERRIELTAKGLDTFAEIRVNGRKIGETANMFLEHKFDVKRFLDPGSNVIEILFDSPVYRAKTLERKHGKLEVALEPHRVYLRKAQYSFGWDWGPKLTTSGIWRDIYFEGCSVGRIHDPWVKVLSTHKKRALVEIRAHLDLVREGRMKLRVTVCNGQTRIEQDAAVIQGVARVSIEIPNPKLWWPNGYGEQALYTASLTLMNEDSVVHNVAVAFGIRTVRLLQQKDDEGKTFIIEVNGTKIFCKGANWIPCDNFIPRISASKYEILLTSARDAHMNMIRVWGGGFYEQDVFYELCDRLGLMVWQDFMFACGEYPKQRWFLSLVEKEVEQVVKRLRNHPSIVLWCGNNECEWIYCTENPGKEPDDMSGSTIFREILPRTVKKHDGTRPYWRSSPWGQGFPNNEANGNHHQWTVWSGWKDYKAYERNQARFVTEFGFQAPANLKTYEAVTIPEDRCPQSPVIEHHNKQIEGTERLFRFQSAHFTIGATFEDFIYKGQLVQAEALKYAVEHWRRRKFKTAGSIFWQLNDCWPVSSWSVIDSALRPKAAWFYAKRFFAPLLVSIRRRRHGIEVWGTNDLRCPVKGVIEVALLSFDGARLLEKKQSINLKTNSSHRLMNIGAVGLPPFDPSIHYIRARFLEEDRVHCENRLFFVEPKHLRLPHPNIQTAIRNEKGATLLTLSTDVFAKNVHLELDHPIPDDNYFDLDAGENKVITIQTNEPVSEIERRLAIRWLESDHFHGR
jgi:beta-mannosidase